MTVGPIRLRRYPSLRQMQKSATVPPNARIFPISHQHMGRFAERDCRAYWGGGNYYVAQMAYAAAVKRWPAAAGRACGEGHLATAITKPRTQLLVGFRRSIAFVCSPGPGSAPALMALPCSKRSQAVAAIVIKKAARAIVAITILICGRCDRRLDWLGMTERITPGRKYAPLPAGRLNPDRSGERTVSACSPRETGHSRVPAPPHMMTGIMVAGIQTPLQALSEPSVALRSGANCLRSNLNVYISNDLAQICANAKHPMD